MYNSDCQICNRKKECNGVCKHKNLCKLYVTKIDEGVVRMKRTNVNAKLLIRRTVRAVGYDLAAAQAVVVPAHGKCPVKTGLAMALPPGCYGRIAPRSGLALKRFIDIGARVIDSDYRGEVGVILFNIGTEDFVVNMGNKIARLIFEKIKTPILKEVNDLEATRRGNKGYGSTGISTKNSETSQEIKFRTTNSNQTKSVQSVSKSSSMETVQDPRNLISY